MKMMPLTQGKYALVDDADYDWLIRFTWHAWWSGWKWYAMDGSRRYMHRLILGLTSFSQKADHKDGNGLNNQRANLRAATNSQNTANSKLRSTNTSGYRGVSWSKKEQLWIASIGNSIRIVAFKEKEEAAKAYDVAAVSMYGEFAVTNFQ